MTPARLRCAHLDNPLGVPPGRVRFGWLPGGAAAQAAYQIRVVPAGSPSPLVPAWESGRAPVWDSGRVASAESADIPYGGPPLESGTRYEWAVRLWSSSEEPGDAGGEPEWSSPACFETELADADWRASWIGLGAMREDFNPPSQAGRPDAVANALRPARCLRREFALTPGTPVAAARLYITALGLYEARINAARVGDAYLTPGWTDYGQRVLYQTYDVTGLLAPGDNTLAVELADGWYSGFVGFDAKRAGAHYGTAPELLAQLAVRYADGSADLVVTDASWEGRSGAVRHADLLMGEKHDLRVPGAGAPGGWRPVQARPLDGRRLTADPGVPVRVTQEVAAAAVTRRDDGSHLVDFGQNLTGWVRVRVGAAPAGTVIGVRHGEVLDEGGNLYTDNLRTARQADEYVLAGEPAVLEPRFTIHGFRYAEICGYPGALAAGDVTARVVHSDIPATGSFESSEPWLGQLAAAIDWGQRGNFINVPTDCPQRDERLGWLGDAQVFARTAAYNRDVAAFFGKWLDDVAEAQLPSGAFPDIAPRLSFPGHGAPAWGDAGVIVPWTVWKMYGDRGILERHFGAMTAWMDFLARGNPDFIRSRELGHNYNDWLAPGRDDTPRELLATAYWAHDAALMAEIAGAAGRAAEAGAYRELWSKIRAAFAAAFVSGDGRLASGTQTAYVLGLHMGLIPESLRPAAADHLVAAIRDADWHLTTGFVGVGYLLPVLSEAGRDDVAHRLLAQRTFPSWRYMLDHGATTIWERWNGWSEEGGFASAWMNSFNHYALGSVGEWLYRYLLGIDQEPGTAGFGRLVLRPHPGGALTFARGSYRSVRGVIKAGWEISGGEFAYRVEIPANVTATVILPGDSGAAGGGGVPGDAGRRVGPGRYEFRERAA